MAKKRTARKPTAKKHTLINTSIQTLEFAVPGGRHIRLAPSAKVQLTERECACYAVTRARQDAMLTMVDPAEGRRVRTLATKTRKAAAAVYDKTATTKPAKKTRKSSTGRKGATNKNEGKSTAKTDKKTSGAKGDNNAKAATPSALGASKVEEVIATPAAGTQTSDPTEQQAPRPTGDAGSESET